jgi:hypothetical protein
MTQHSLDCPTALVIFKITHQDRAGETGTVIKKEGEVVASNHEGQAIIAVTEGDIILCPAGALHTFTEGMMRDIDTTEKHDFIAAVELTRWFPANPNQFSLRWLDPRETQAVVAARSST